MNADKDPDFHPRSSVSKNSVGKPSDETLITHPPLFATPFHVEKVIDFLDLSLRSRFVFGVTTLIPTGPDRRRGLTRLAGLTRFNLAHLENPVIHVR